MPTNYSYSYSSYSSSSSWLRTVKYTYTNSAPLSRAPSLPRFSTGLSGVTNTFSPIEARRPLHQSASLVSRVEPRRSVYSSTPLWSSPERNNEYVNYSSLSRQFSSSLPHFSTSFNRATISSSSIQPRRPLHRSASSVVSAGARPPLYARVASVESQRVSSASLSSFPGRDNGSHYRSATLFSPLPPTTAINGNSLNSLARGDFYSAGNNNFSDEESNYEETNDDSSYRSSRRGSEARLQDCVSHLYARARTELDADTAANWLSFADETNASSFLMFINSLENSAERVAYISSGMIVQVLAAAAKDNALREQLFNLAAEELGDCQDRRLLVFNNMQVLAEVSRLTHESGADKTQALLSLVCGTTRQQRLTEFVSEKLRGRDGEALELELALRVRLGDFLNLPFPISNMHQLSYANTVFSQYLSAEGLLEVKKFILDAEENKEHFLNTLLDNEVWTAHLQELYKDEVIKATEHLLEDLNELDERQQRELPQIQRLNAQDKLIDEYLQTAQFRFDQNPSDANKATIARLNMEKKRITQELSSMYTDGQYLMDVDRLMAERKGIEKAFLKAVTLSLL